ncbi:MAG: hypothetical protein KAG61_08875 [Bacteriovoracaceae bacterium]|nr:hypothetical protein [Bacteriovoracaceae bacterium]
MLYNTTITRNLQSFFIPLILLCALQSIAAHGAMQDIWTTRLKSTSGAGVASLLIDESTMLNPAPMAFYNRSYIYYEYTKSDIAISDESGHPDPKRSKENTVVTSDGAQKVKGSFSYTVQNHDRGYRKRISASTAYPMSKKASMGITYRYTKDTSYENGVEQKQSTNNQMVIGFYHQVKSYFSLGMTFTDPLKNVENETIALVGGQLSYQDMISFMFDAGANYYEDMADTFLFRGGLQLKMLSDFLLRFGYSRDNGRKESGNSMGVTWVSPRLILNFALRNIKVEKDILLNQRQEKIRESSFSMSLHF